MNVKKLAWIESVVKKIMQHKVEPALINILINDDDDFRDYILTCCKESLLHHYTITFVLQNRKYPTLKPFHLDLIKALEKLELDVNSKHLIINMPVGFGKTENVQRFVHWCFGRNKNHNYMYLSGAKGNARQIADSIKQTVNFSKDNIEGSFWKRIFDQELRFDSKATTQFAFKGSQQRSGFFAAGIYSNITGRDAGNPNIVDNNEPVLSSLEETIDYINGLTLSNQIDNKIAGGGLILDDILGAVDAGSIVKKERLINIFNSSAFTRLRGKNNKCILLMQRLSVDDPVGWILNSEFKDMFDVFKIKAFNEELDCSNWEERISTNELKIRKVSQPSVFYAQYQQEPILDESPVFKREWFSWYTDIKHHKTIPRGSFIFMTADTANKKKRHADYSVVCVWAVMEDGLFLLDMMRDKLNYPDLEQNIIMIWNKWMGKLGDVNYINPFGLNHHPSGLYLSQIHIENEASGIQLCQSDVLRQAGVQYRAIDRYCGKIDRVTGEPRQGGGKFEKTELVLSVSSWIARGFVYLPKTNDKIHFSEALVNECLQFTRDDTHAHDDIVDCLTDAVRIGIIDTGFFNNRLVDNKKIDNNLQ